MTKRWSSTTSDLTRTKRDASKAARAEGKRLLNRERIDYDPDFVASVLAADASPVAASFSDVDAMLDWLNGPTV